MPVVKGIMIRRLRKEAPAKRWTRAELLPLVRKSKLNIPGAFPGKYQGTERTESLRCVFRKGGGLWGVTIHADTDRERVLLHKSKRASCWDLEAFVGPVR